MKARLFLLGVVVRRCHSYGYVASSRLASQKNPSLSFCSSTFELQY
jgi:hypothetical protein